MRILLVIGVIGQLIRLFSLAFVPPALLALWDGNFEEFAFFPTPAGVLEEFFQNILRIFFSKAVPKTDKGMTKYIFGLQTKCLAP